MSDESPPELGWDTAPEVPLEELEIDDELARWFRHLLPRTVVLLGLMEGSALVAAAHVPEDDVVEKIVESTGVPEIDLVRVSPETLAALHARLRES